ncbi:MAG: cytochrome c-type biogenesis protein CcmH [Anaerolineae bacterium]|nr:cytochrome c-type biogenesis protein CcmH [Anaerolineae bacterium]
MMSFQKVTLKLTLSLFLAIIVYLLLTTYYLLPISYFTTFAQETDYDRVNEIAKHLNCPTCAGINLADCRTLTCEQWRDQIDDLVKQGYSDKEVLDYFVTRFGEQVLQEPPKSGSTLFLWVLPVTILLAGGVWLAFALRRWAGREVVPVATASPEINPASNVPQPPHHYLGQVEKDLNLGDGD